MFQQWRQRIRQAESAFRQGRLDEAGKLLRQDNLREFLPGKQLAAKLAAEIAQRAKKVAALGNTRAGWRDLQAAAELDSTGATVQAARESFLAAGLSEVERSLEVGAYESALSRLSRLEERHGQRAEIRTLRLITSKLQAATAAQRRGAQTLAEEQFAACAALRPDLAWFPPLLAACRLKGSAYRQQVEQLQAALACADWPQVLHAATALLALAPESVLALAARREAWEKLRKSPGGAVGQVRGERHLTEHYVASRGDRAATAQNRSNVNTAASDLATSDPAHQQQGSQTVDQRFILWIDAVGGFLVCTGNEIVLGRPADGTLVDVPILADLSRRHAVVRRDGEAYLLEAVQETKLDGRPVKGLATLVDGSLIELGSAVEIRFRRPHPLSGTARLEIVSGHRTEPHVDAVLLMAESCVLGPAWHNHVVCRPWQGDIVLFRQQEQLHCRSKMPLTIDGQPPAGPQALLPGMRVEGEDLAFSVDTAS